MARPNQHIRQPALHHNYILSHTRNVPQGLYHSRGPRHGQPRNVNRNNHQGNASPNIIRMSNEPGNAGQSSVIFPSQNVNANGPRPPMFITSQVTSTIHSGHNNSLQQTPIYPVNNQIPFSSQPVVSSSQTQKYFPNYPPQMILTHNGISYQGFSHPSMSLHCLPPPSQPPFPQNNQINVTHVPTAPSYQTVIAGNDVLPQVTHPQHNKSPPNMPVQNINIANNNIYKRLKTRPNAVTDIIDPETGRNIAEDIYESVSPVPPVQNEQPNVISITHPNSTQHNKPAKVFPRLTITVSPSSTSSTSMYSENLSPIPLSTSSRLNSPDKSSIDINSNSRNQSVPVNNQGDHVRTEKKSNCHEALASSNNSQDNHDCPSTPSVPEAHCSQSQVHNQNETSCHRENESATTVEVPVNAEENQAEVAVSSKSVGPSKGSSKSQKKKNKRKPKNRDLNLNQVRNVSTSSEEASNARAESSKEDVKEAKPTPIPEIKEDEEEQIAESKNPHVCDQINVKEELNIQNQSAVKNEPEIQNNHSVEIEEDLINQQPEQDSNLLQFPKKTSSTSSNKVKIEKCDITIEAPHFEDLVKQENENRERKDSSRGINTTNIRSRPIEPPDNLFSFEITKNCVINNVPDECYIRGANGINFFFSKMPEDTEEIPNYSQPQEQQNDDHSHGSSSNDHSHGSSSNDHSHGLSSNDHSHGLSSNDDEIKKEDRQDISIEVEHQQDIKIKVEVSQDVQVKTEPQNELDVEPQENTEIKVEQEINTDVESEYQKSDEIKPTQSNCIEVEQELSVVHRIENVSDKTSDMHEEQASDVEIKSGKKEDDNLLPEPITEEKEQPSITPSASENCKVNSDDDSNRKTYSREVLMDIRDKKECWIYPGLPDCDIVKHNVKRPSSNVSTIPPTRNFGHDILYPSFSRPTTNIKVIPTNRRSFQGKSKSHKPALIRVSLSLNEDIKLRKTENAWKPSLLQKEKSKDQNNEDIVLFKKVRSVLNKLTPEKFQSLVEQVKQLEIKSLVQLKGIIDILFQKAISEPLYSSYYALMCKELSDKSIPKIDCNEVTDNDVSGGKNVVKRINLRRLVIESCQEEFHKNSLYEGEHNQKVRKMENIKDDNNRKELELEEEEERNKMKRRCLGNIKFVGELYKQGMITSNIMEHCIEILLKNNDEESLENLCKLLITIGKLLEERKVKLSSCFDDLGKLIHKNATTKLSSRIRFMIQDIIELRDNEWVPRRKENNPKTMGQIKKEVETERINNDMMSFVPSHSHQSHNRDFVPSRKDERDSNNDRRRSFSGARNNASSNENNDWSSVRSCRMRSSASLSIKAKSNFKDEETIFNSNSLITSNRVFDTRNTIVASNKFSPLATEKKRRSSMASSDPPKELRPEYTSFWQGCENQKMRLSPMSMQDNSSSLLPPFSIKRTLTPPTPPKVADDKQNNQHVDENKLEYLVKSLIDESSSDDVDAFMENARESIEDKFSPQSYPLLMEVALNSVLERSQTERQRFSALIAQLIKDKIIPFSVFQTEFEKLLEIADDLIIDIPQCWKYFSEILTEIAASNSHPFIEETQKRSHLRKFYEI